MRYPANHFDYLVGARRGHLLILGIDHVEKRTGKIWKCQCDCGNITYLPTSRISSGTATSCPECGKREHLQKCAAQLRTHGLQKKNMQLYRIWKSMRSRCRFKGDTNYKYYGAENKSICDEWNDYAAFYAWAYKSGYAHGLTIDRIDPAKGYSPENCRWTTMTVQNINKLGSRLITVNGVTMCQNHWAKAIGVNHALLVYWRKQGKLTEKIMARYPKEFKGYTTEIQGKQVFIWRED